jgi:hypothetical protein
MSRTDQLLALCKRQGMTSISKVILEDDAYAKAVTEEEFTNMLMQEAIAWQREGESIGQSFSRMFSADTSEGLLLRKAHAAVKAANASPVVTESMSKSSFNKLSKRDSGSSAYDQLIEKAEQLRKFDPELSIDQAFAKVYTDKANRGLAEQERRENRPQSTNDPWKQ